MSGRRAGSAPLIVLMCIAMAELVAAGSLVVTARAAAHARAVAEVVKARAGAESAVRAATAGWDMAAFGSVAVGSIVPVPAGAGSLPGGVTHTATVERLASHRWLLRGEAQVRGGARPAARARASAIVLTLPLDSLWLDFGAAWTSGGDVVLATGAVVDGGTASLFPPPWTAAQCPPAAVNAMQRALGSAARPGIAMASGATLSALGASVTGSPPLVMGAARADSAANQRLAGLMIAEIALIADRFETGSLQPAPVMAGSACDTTAPGNWGAPLAPSHACADWFPLIYAPGDLSVSGGSGQGLLVVAGDLTLAGTSFHGVVHVGGRLRATRSTIHGAVRTAGGTGAPADLRIAHSACSLWRAFERSPALRRAYRPPGRWWLPPF